MEAPRKGRRYPLIQQCTAYGKAYGDCRRYAAPASLNTGSAAALDPVHDVLGGFFIIHSASLPGCQMEPSWSSSVMRLPLEACPEGPVGGPWPVREA